mmetsp:Transcript_21884/g.33956  ORF Transcript_21884/g.33956 Transcript_21884/m.33956 type:complete len:155 (+) Transcript_21884:2048-2512(+)
MIGISKDKGRDSTAICDNECTIFVLPESEIRKIKDSFEDIYQEMLEIAVKRHKNHQILIAREVKAYILKQKLDSEPSDSSEFDSDYGSQSANSNGSLNSEKLEADFQRTLQNKKTADPIAGLSLVKKDSLLKKGAATAINMDGDGEEFRQVNLN